MSQLFKFYQNLFCFQILSVPTQVRRTVCLGLIKSISILNMVVQFIHN